MKVNVQQDDGTISIGRGEEPEVYEVSGGTVEVPDDKVDDFLARVPGASVERAASDDETSSTGSWS